MQDVHRMPSGISTANGQLSWNQQDAGAKRFCRQAASAGRPCSSRLPVRRYLPVSSEGVMYFYSHQADNWKDTSKNIENHEFPPKYMREGFLAELELSPGDLFSTHDELELEGGPSPSYWQYRHQKSTSAPEKGELQCLQDYFQEYPEKLKHLQQAPVLVPWSGYFSQRNSPWLSSVITQLFLSLKKDQEGFVAVIRDDQGAGKSTAGQWQSINREVEQWKCQKPLHCELFGQHENLDQASPQQDMHICGYPGSGQTARGILSVEEFGHILSRVVAPPLTRKNLIQQLVKNQANLDDCSTDELMQAFLGRIYDPDEKITRAWTLYQGDSGSQTDLIALKGSLRHLCREQLIDRASYSEHQIPRMNNGNSFDDAWLVDTINQRISNIDDVLKCITAYQKRTVARHCVDPKDGRLEVTAVSLKNLRKFRQFLNQCPPKEFSSGVRKCPVSTPCNVIEARSVYSNSVPRGVFYISTGDNTLQKGVAELIMESPITARELCNIGQNADISTQVALEKYLQFSMNCIHYRPMYLGMRTSEFTAAFSRSETHSALMTMINHVCDYALMHPLLTITPIPVPVPDDSRGNGDPHCLNEYVLPIKRSFSFIPDVGIQAIVSQSSTLF